MDQNNNNQLLNNPHWLEIRQQAGNRVQTAQIPKDPGSTLENKKGNVTIVKPQSLLSTVWLWPYGLSAYEGWGEGGGRALSPFWRSA